MLVGAEGRLVGTIGGGAVEGRSIQLCRELLDQRRSCIREFPLHQAPERDIGMVCGGDVTAHFQFIPAEDPLWNDTASRALALLEQHTAGWLVLAEDGSAPALVSVDPPDGSAGLGLTPTIRFTFSEPLWTYGSDGLWRLTQFTSSTGPQLSGFQAS